MTLHIAFIQDGAFTSKAHPWMIHCGLNVLKEGGMLIDFAL